MASAQESINGEIVILLHGIGHNKWNMFLAERTLKKCGYATFNLTYPPIKHDIAALSVFVEQILKKASIWQNYGKVHFVTHSMGGVIARTYLNSSKDTIPRERMGRVVMIVPPNQGSEISDLLKDFFLYRWIFGPAGQQLTTSHQIQQEANVYYDLGIIAGEKRWPYPVARFIVPDESDGRIAVSRIKLEGMADHIVVSATHSFIAWKASTHRLVMRFLKHGRFGEQ
jgi:pimeloyl-ACP methyl ester carboxylesterase